MGFIETIVKLRKRKKQKMDIGKNHLNHKKDSEFVAQLPEPENLIERSYLQYKCQMSKKSLLSRFTQNSAAIVVLPYYLLKPYKAVVKNNTTRAKKSAIYLCSENSRDILPGSLIAEFDKIDELPILGSVFLDKKDREFIKKKLFKYWHCPLFVLKCTMKIGIYSNGINQYSPDAAISHNEYSFTSSLLTAYCHFRSVEHINVMHGEKIYNILDAFATFDRFYVWDDHYKKMFIKLRCFEKQFTIEQPKKLFLDLPVDEKVIYEMTYYLTIEDKDLLEKVRDVLLKTKIPSNKICIRRHPTSSSIDDVLDVFGDFVIENPEKVDLSTSLARAGAVFCRSSTVQMQAYLANKDLVIDDITYPEFYQTMIDLEFNVLSKPHILLSEYLKKVE